jgi:hypothetical protein
VVGDIMVKDINDSLVNKLDFYFVEHGYEQTTIGKLHTVMKKIIKIAERKGFLYIKKICIKIIR